MKPTYPQIFMFICVFPMDKVCRFYFYQPTLYFLSYLRFLVRLNPKIDLIMFNALKFKLLKANAPQSNGCKARPLLIAPFPWQLSTQ